MSLIGARGEPGRVSLPKDNPVCSNQVSRRPALDPVIVVVAVPFIPQHRMLEFPFGQLLSGLLDRRKFAPGDFDDDKSSIREFFFPPDQVASE